MVSVNKMLDGVNFRFSDLKSKTITFNGVLCSRTDKRGFLLG